MGTEVIAEPDNGRTTKGSDIGGVREATARVREALVIRESSAGFGGFRGRERRGRGKVERHGSRRGKKGGGFSVQRRRRRSNSRKRRSGGQRRRRENGQGRREAERKRSKRGKERMHPMLVLLWFWFCFVLCHIQELVMSAIARSLGSLRSLSTREDSSRGQSDVVIHH